MNFRDDFDWEEKRNRYNNKWELDFPDVYKDVLKATDIGGVKNVVYRPIKYDDYDWTYSDDDRFEEGLYLFAKGKPDVTYNPETDFNNVDLLVSLLNLAKNINKEEPDKDNERRKEIKEDQRVPVVDQIIEWCQMYVHPYDTDALYNKYVQLKDETNRKDMSNEYDSCFKVDDFLKDLVYFYNTYSFYYAFREALFGYPEQAYNLYYDGPHFETFPFFEKYKLKSWKPNNTNLDKTIKEKKTKEEIQKDRNELLKEMSQPTKVEYATMEEFCNNIKKDEKQIKRLLVSLIPDVQMHLEMNLKTGDIEFVANVNSVFDLCWYTLARQISVVGSALPENTKRVRSYNWTNCQLGVCPVCKEYFPKASNRQIYCSNRDCQKKRKAKNFKDFYDRQKANEK